MARSRSRARALDRAHPAAPQQQRADLVGADRAAGEEDRGAVDEIAQLADIAGPAMLGQAGIGVRRELTRPRPGCRARKCPTSSGMSSRRSASAGRCRGEGRRGGRTGPRGTRPSSIAASMSRWVAATMRTSTVIWPRPPTRCTARSSSTRSSFTCMSAGMSPISSRKRVPPSASSKRPSCWA